ncbi:hypothetical protein AOXY_G21959 [Acipenser oxyrinchus oxyrinchus]|uniref:Securin n=1 Tax=Acipenser oxyrinchus oxyrinchus TaxID=40147 RepID=A0AAD8CYL5_ACIOX|nr:hypothetical protein AOXY_G21959 [Acipenser oxyrinchus oxyrinchus]
MTHLQSARRALGTVNLISSTRPGVAGIQEKSAAATNIEVKAGMPVKGKAGCPEIERFIPYNPAAFESFDVPEDQRLSHLCLAGLAAPTPKEELDSFSVFHTSMKMSPLKFLEDNFCAEVDSFLQIIENEKAKINSPKMATMIFVDKENGELGTTVGPKKRTRLLSAPAKTFGEKVLQAPRPGKVFGMANPLSARKALGTVNKISSVRPDVSGNKLKSKVAAKPTEKAKVCMPVKERQEYPEIEKFIPYNPVEFESFDVPEDQRLSHLCLAGLAAPAAKEELDSFSVLHSCMKLSPLKSQKGMASVKVIQPHSMNATVGEDVILNCTFKSSSTVGSSNWYKDGVNISNDTPPYRGRLVFSSTDSFKAKDASLKIVNLSLSDSGNYTCRVEALGDSAGCGSGTLLVVGPKRSADKSGVLDVNIWTIIPVAAAVFTVIIIVIIALCFVLQRRGKYVRREAIYQNVGTGNVQLNSILGMYCN